MLEFPYEFVDISPEELETGKIYFAQWKYVKVGPKKYILNKQFEHFAKDIYNLKLKSDDVFVLGFCRSGTTWTQEMVWLLQNNLDFDKANTVRSTERVALLDVSTYLTPEKLQTLKTIHKNEDLLKKIDIINQSPSVFLSGFPSPRTVKTHLALSLLPPQLLDDAKVVYICRDPRDVLVSLHKMIQRLPWNPCQDTSFSEFLEVFPYCSYGPYFEAVKEAWEKRHHPNMLFVFYEELVMDLPSALKKMAKFLNKTVTEDDIAKLCDYLDIKKFKKNNQVNEDLVNSFLGTNDDGTKDFIRRGGVGGWKEYFNEEDRVRVEKWIKENLEGTDLRFPTLEM